LAALWIAATPGYAAEDPFAGVEVKATRVAGSVYMLTGAGGNIGVSIGDDGTLIVDDQFAPLAERILAALTSIGGKRPKLVLNTHYHGDHTGSNAFFGESGTIIAHDNVRVRLVADPQTVRGALPLVTFADRLRVHFNDEEIELVHMPHGHTDGDSVVWFRNANVVHMGDHFFNGRFPFIDIQGGGSVKGFIANLEAVLEMAPADVRIIPGHGELARIADLERALGVSRTTSSTVSAALAAGESADALVARGLGPDYAEWGSGFINEERWIRIIEADRNAGR
jgi:glyoxylase-like metal-dependent hydrolase (beta-lactamase superfamily II)